MKKPSAEEVCRIIELITMFNDEDENNYIDLFYRMTHIRENSSICPHNSWIQEFRRHQKFWINLNKAPNDPTKVHNLKY